MHLQPPAAADGRPGEGPHAGHLRHRLRRRLCAPRPLLGLTCYFCGSTTKRAILQAVTSVEVKHQPCAAYQSSCVSCAYVAACTALLPLPGASQEHSLSSTSTADLRSSQVRCFPRCFRYMSSCTEHLGRCCALWRRGLRRSPSGSTPAAWLKAGGPVRAAQDACNEACQRAVCTNLHQVPAWNDACLKRCTTECLRGRAS